MLYIQCEKKLHYFQAVHLSVKGGSSPKECVKRIMKSLMKDSCCRLFNWRGKGDKRAFSNLKLRNVINSKYCDTNIDDLVVVK